MQAIQRNVIITSQFDSAEITHSLFDAIRVQKLKNSYNFIFLFQF